MTTEKEPSGIKSAYDLAMEKLEQTEGVHAPVSEEQKKAIAQVDSETQAKIAEIEISSQHRVGEALASGDVGKIQELEAQRVDETRKAREEGEAKKDAVRKSSEQ